MFKKIGGLFLCMIVVGCSKEDDRVEQSINEQHIQVEAEASEDRITKEVAVITPKQITSEDALAIQKSIQETFRDAWYWYEVFMPPFEENRAVLADELMNFYMEIATENYLNMELRNEILATCNACDALPFYELPIEQALSIEFQQVDPERFVLHAHYPISIFSPERFVTFTYILQQQQWKIDEVTVEVIRPIEAYNEEDEKHDLEVGSQEMLPTNDETWQRFLTLEEAYYYNSEIYDAQREEELVAYMNDLLLQVQQLYQELTATITTGWPEYEQVIQRFEQMIVRQQQANEALYPSGTTQRLYNLQGEIEMRLYKIEMILQHLKAL